jgi:hypothetical protein
MHSSMTMMTTGRHRAAHAKAATGPARPAIGERVRRLATNSAMAHQGPGAKVARRDLAAPGPKGLRLQVARPKDLGAVAHAENRVRPISNFKLCPTKSAFSTGNHMNSHVNIATLRRINKRASKRVCRR